LSFVVTETPEVEQKWVSMPESKKLISWTILVFLWAVIYLGTLATPAFFDDADSIHAEAAREMAASGDWITLHINHGVRYLEKAPLMYWLSALGVKLFGPSEWAIRLPIALFAGLLTILLYFFGARFWGERAGYYAALVYVTSLGPFAFTRILLPDVMLTFFISAAFYCYLQVVADPEAGPRIGGRWDPRVLAIYACSALAVLTKGLIGCVFVGGWILLHVILTGRWELLRRAHIAMGLLVFLVIAAPWHVIAGIRNQGFLWFYFVNEHFLRYLGLRYPKDYDTVPLLLFWVLHLAWVFPWSIFLWGLRHTFPRRLRSKTPAEQVNLFLYLWVALIIVFFSFSTSQEYYTFPTLPGFALLLGQVLARLDSGDGEGDQRKALISTGILAALGGLLAAGLLGLAWLGRSGMAAGDLTGTLTWNPSSYALSFGHFQDLTPATFGRLFWLVTATALLFLFGPLMAWMTARRSALRRDWRLPALFLALMMAGLLHCYHAGMVAFQPVLSSKGLAEAILKEYQTDDQIVINGRYEIGSSINYYTQKPVNILNGRIGNLWFGSFFPDSRVIFYVDSTFLQAWESGQRMFFYSEGPVFQAFLKRHPEFSYRVLAEAGGKKIMVNW
jgi:4-amino-4-deoxy-L-arabinose transferase-like glycosyltransferase